MKIQPLFRLLSGFLSVDKQNANSDRIENAFENTLSRDGTGPNAMLANLDMDSNRIINLADPIDPSDAVTLDFITNNFGDIQVGPEGPQGPIGPQGIPGAPGSDGDDGDAATIVVGTVTTGAPGSDAQVINVGTTSAAVFDFIIPRGATGAAGSGSGDMVAANNLSELTDDAQARTNLGLGTMAVEDAADYSLTTHDHTGVYAPVSHTHTISQVTDISAFASTILDDTSASAVRSTLGLGTLATASTVAAADVTNQSQLKPTESFIFALSDETTSLTTGTAKVTFRAPYAFTITGLRANINTVSSSGLVTVDMNKSGSTMLSTKLTIDASEKTSVTAATAHVFSSTTWADDEEITFDIDTAGTGAKGLKVTVIGNRT